MTIRGLFAGTILLTLTAAQGAAAGDWIELLPGKDLSAWRQPRGDWTVVRNVRLDPKDPKRLTWTAGTGEAVNGPKGRTVDLFSVKEFGDIEAHIEFIISSRSNSGIYFQGRYELQVYDSYGVAKDAYPGIECGGIYPRWVNNQDIEGHSPRVNASLPPGQWQTFERRLSRAAFRRVGQEDGQRPIRSRCSQRQADPRERGGQGSDARRDSGNGSGDRPAEASGRPWARGLSQCASPSPGAVEGASVIPSAAGSVPRCPPRRCRLAMRPLATFFENDMLLRLDHGPR